MSKGDSHFSIQQAAEIAGMSVSTIRRWIQKGKLAVTQDETGVPRILKDEMLRLGILKNAPKKESKKTASPEASTTAPAAAPAQEAVARPASAPPGDARVAELEAQLVESRRREAALMEQLGQALRNLTSAHESIKREQEANAELIRKALPAAPPEPVIVPRPRPQNPPPAPSSVKSFFERLLKL